MSKKILFVFLSLLVLLNVTLLTILIVKPQKKGPPRDIFLAEELQFSHVQKEKFRELDRKHRRKMRSIDDKIRDVKEDFFKSFSNPNFNPEKKASMMGNLEAQKDLEVFRFFSEVRKLCTPDQARHFDDIIQGAMRGGRRGPPPNRRRPPPPRRDF